MAGRGLGIGPPDEKTHVEAACDGPVQHVEQRAASIRQEKVVGIEGNGQPDAVARALDRLADPPHGLLAIDQRANEIARPCGIGTRRRRRNVHGMAGERRHETIGAGTSSASLSVVNSVRRPHCIWARRSSTGERRREVSRQMQRCVQIETSRCSRYSRCGLAMTTRRERGSVYVALALPWRQEMTTPHAGYGVMSALSHDLSGLKTLIAAASCAVSGPRSFS